jgi:hypothetical protein
LDKRIIAAPHAHRRQPIAITDVVESLGGLVAWRWRSGVQLEWVSRQDYGKAAHTIVHMGDGRTDVEFRETFAVIACDKREAFAQGSESDEAIHPSAHADRWIASLRSQ